MTDLYNPRHPHEPDLPVVLDDEGRCRVCLILVERDEARELAKRFMLERNRLVNGIVKFGGLLVGWETNPTGERLFGWGGLYAAFRELWSLLDVATDDREDG